MNYRDPYPLSMPSDDRTQSFQATGYVRSRYGWQREHRTFFAKNHLDALRHKHSFHHMRVDSITPTKPVR